MTLEARQNLYRELEAKRGRPLIAYVTSPRQNATAMMGVDAIPELLDQLEALPADTKAVDLLTVSNGGDPTVAWRIMCLLRERVQTVGIIIPQAAFSAATLLALGADELIMHAHGNLGPVDPQIMVERKKTGTEEVERFKFGFEELAGFLEFAKTYVGLTDQEHLRALFERFCGEVGTVPVGVATRSARLSTSLGEKLLRMHMKEPVDAQKAKVITEALNKNFFHHGYPLGRTEAREIGLKVASNAGDVEAIAWKIWLDMEKQLKARTPFLPVAELANSPAAAQLFGPVNQINFSGLAGPMLGQIVNAILQQTPPTVPVDLVPYEVETALVESVRCASHCVQRGKMMAVRTPDLQISVNMAVMFAGWEPVIAPAVPATAP